MTEVTIDPEEYAVDENDTEDIQRGLELLQKERLRKAKISAGLIKGGQTWAELSDEQKEARLLATKKRNARLMILSQKAIDNGITVSEEEITSYIEMNSKK